MNILSEIIMASKADALCIFILVMILFQVRRDTDQQYTTLIFTHIVLAGIGNAIFFSASNLIDTGMITASRTVGFWVNALYFISLVILTLLWFFYAEIMVGSSLIRTKGRAILCSLPALLFCAAVLLSAKTHWIFYIGEGGVYQRGKFFMIQYAVTYGYLTFTTFKVLYLSRLKSNYARASEYRILAIFPLPALAVSIIQLFCSQTMLISIGFTLGVLLVYLNIQTIKISVDSLTKLNNRNQLVIHLSNKMRNRNPASELYLLLMDVDYFKAINDKYGHIEGDTALVRIAEALKCSARQRNSVAFRYGGDEFIIVFEGNGEEAECLCSDIHKNLARLNEKARSPYKLSLSIGYAKYSQDIGGIPEFIHKADEVLYEVKRNRRREK